MGWLGLLLLAACKPRVDYASQVRVANGVETTAYTEVVLLVNTASGATCTGTFVAPRVIVTAAHCVTAADGSDLAFGGQAPVRAFHGAVLGDPAALRADDLALIVFATELAAAVARIGDSEPVVGDEVEVVGFGRLDAADSATSGIKRRGKNKLAATENGFLIVEGVSAPSAGVAPGDEAVGARGDSGGPLFQSGQLVGIDSGGGSKAAGAAGLKRTKYVDLTSAASRGVLCKAVQAGLSLEGYDGAHCAP